jgi:AcrR family transcriptional regulator
MPLPDSPATTTRDRILDVARELFTDQGYEGTSLRQIADRLGFTKAALYYHFQSKDQLLEALLQPFSEMADELLSRLEATATVEEWGEVLCTVVDRMSEHMALFRLLERNRNVIEHLDGWGEQGPAHAQLHERLETAVRTKTDSLRDQVRMVAALGAVTGFDDWAPTLMLEAPPDQLQAELNAAVRDMLGLPARPAAASST